MKRLASLPLLLVTLVAAVNAHACPGDCDNSGMVAVAEMETGVSKALGAGGGVSCSRADVGGDGSVTVDELVLAVIAHLHGCPTPVPSPTPTTTPLSVAPIFPADYRSTFVEVRNCRFSTEHGGVNIRVLTNPIAAQPYVEEQPQLPVGSIVVKEEFSANDCNDASLVRWRAMRKEEPGFDAEDGDWHWQWVNPDRSVLFDDKSTCIGCHIRPACVARDYMCTEEGTAPLSAILEDLPGALLSVSGTSPSDVFAVGTDPTSDALGPLVMHYNGTNWQRLNSHATGDLWWIGVEPIDGLFYMAGDGGLILQMDPATGNFTKMETPTTALLYGIWGAAANDIWAVGGDLTLTEDKAGIVLHYDGFSWTKQDLTGVTGPNLPTLFKVWGRSASEVYAVGQGGAIIRYDGMHWTQLSSSTLQSLFTVHGNASHVIAVGGFFDGVILESQGDAFEDQTPIGMPQMNGLFVPASGVPVAVGLDLALAKRYATGWRVLENTPGLALDFHGTWVDPEGGVWAVGGDLSGNLDKGRLEYTGPRTISSVIQQPPRCPPGAAGPGGTVSYADDVVPVLRQAHCLDLGCHGGAFPSSGYDQRTYTSSFKQGVEAQALDVCPIVPGDPDTSFLVEKIQAAPRLGNRMPSGFPALTQEKIDLIRTWVMEGARNN